MRMAATAKKIAITAALTQRGFEVRSGAAFAMCFGFICGSGECFGAQTSAPPYIVQAINIGASYRFIRYIPRGESSLYFAMAAISFTSPAGQGPPGKSCHSLRPTQPICIARHIHRRTTDRLVGDLSHCAKRRCPVGDCVHLCNVADVHVAPQYDFLDIGVSTSPVD